MNDKTQGTKSFYGVFSNTIIQPKSDCIRIAESVDFEVKASDHFSFHLLYTLDAEGCEVNSREEGADSGLSASLSPAIVFDGHDFDIGDLHIKKMIASLEGRGELKYAIGRAWKKSMHEK